MKPWYRKKKVWAAILGAVGPVLTIFLAPDNVETVKVIAAAIMQAGIAAGFIFAESSVDAADRKRAASGKEQAAAAEAAAAAHAAWEIAREVSTHMDSLNAEVIAEKVLKRVNDVANAST